MNNKFSFIANIKKEDIHKDLAKKVRYEINKYLLSIDCFSLMQSTDSLIFGGAVRDSIVGLEIHDLDIVVLPQAFQTISKRLSDAGFKKIEKYSLDIISLYNGISQIHEPINWVKDSACVQLIRPRQTALELSKGKNAKNILYDFVSNVDISCCAVSFFPNETLLEHLPGAIEQCLYKTFHIIKSATLYNESRIIIRSQKLTRRGWTEKELKVKEATINICTYCVNHPSNCGHIAINNSCDNHEEELPF